MDAALVDITADLAEGFARLMLHVSEHRLSEADVVAVRKLADTADLVLTHTVAHFADETEFRELGHRDVGSWLSAKTGARHGEGQIRCAQARLLDDLPEVGAAVLAGTFSAAHLRCLSAAVTRARLGLAQRDEAVFVRAGAALDATQFAQVVQRWSALADDELSDPENQCGDEGFGARRVQFNRMLSGSWRLTGVFDPMAGEAIAAMLAAVTPPPSPDDPRTPAQRRADGFADLCIEFLSRSDRCVVGNERPNVNVVFHAADGSAQTTGGWYLRNWQLSQVLCGATLTALGVTLEGKPFDVGTPFTAIPVRNRRAVVVRDRCCRFPHCARPARRADRAVSGGIGANPKGSPQGWGATSTTFGNGPTTALTSFRIWSFCAHIITAKCIGGQSRSRGTGQRWSPPCRPVSCSTDRHTRQLSPRSTIYSISRLFGG